MNKYYIHVLNVRNEWDFTHRQTGKNNKINICYLMKKKRKKNTYGLIL
jgi:hypothetical protein